MDSPTQLSERSDHWNDVYSQEKKIPPYPSQFAIFLKSWIGNDPISIIEFGCGNARDGFFFASQGHQVLGLDASTSAIQDNTSRGKGIDNIDFHVANVGESLFKDQPLIEKIESYGQDRQQVFYSRFFQHAITEAEEDAMLGFIHAHANSNAKVFFEFRSDKDSDQEKEFGQHFRRYQSLTSFSERLIAHNFAIEYSVEGFGYAIYKAEDPHIMRVVAKLE